MRGKTAKGKEASNPKGKVCRVLATCGMEAKYGSE